MAINSARPTIGEQVISCKVIHGYNHYNYSIREENGRGLFSAYYRGESDGYKTVEINDIAVSPEDMTELGRLCDKYLLATELNENGNSNDSNLTAGVEIIWKSGKRFETAIYTWDISDNKDELLFIAQLLSFFDSLTQRLEACYYERPARLLAEGNVQAFSYSEGRGGLRPISYELRTDMGEILFDTDDYIDSPDGTSAGDSNRIQLRDEQMPNEDMKTLNLLCTEHKLIEQQNTAASVRRKYIEPSWKSKPAVFDVERYLADGGGVAPAFTVVWDNGACLKADSLPTGTADRFRGFFRSLVTRIQSGPAKKAPEGDVVSVLYSRDDKSQFAIKIVAAQENSQKKHHGFSFSLCAESGELLFDAYCLFNDLHGGNRLDREFRLESVSAPMEYMEELRRICEKHSFSEKWHSYPAKKIEDKELAFGRQGSITRERLEVVWENGARLDMRLFFGRDYIPSFELSYFFSELAKKLDKTRPAGGNVVSFRLKGAYSSKHNGKPIFFSNMMPSAGGKYDLQEYEYHMREAEGDVLFSAYESDHPRISNRLMSINELIPAIGKTHLEQLQALCEKHDFAGKIQAYHSERWGSFFSSDLIPTDSARNPNYDFFEIEWENGARCEGTTLPGEFRDFFSEMVSSVFPRAKAETVSSALTPAPAAVRIWTCNCGHAGNTANFCVECGTRNPQ